MVAMSNPTGYNRLREEEFIAPPEAQIDLVSDAEFHDLFVKMNEVGDSMYRQPAPEVKVPDPPPIDYTDESEGCCQ